MREENTNVGHKEAFSLAVAGWSLMSDEEKAVWRPVAASSDPQPMPPAASSGSDGQLGEEAVSATATSEVAQESNDGKAVGGGVTYNHKICT